MHVQNLDPWKHPHRFVSDDRRGETRVRLVVLLTLTLMILEIGAGHLYGSMALLADGWHMGTHASALGISLLACVLARKYADDKRFSFGTGKVGALAGFASAILLAGAACLMASESFQRIRSPTPILFEPAIMVAVIGLVANLVSAHVLRSDDDGPHESRGGHHQPHEHHLRAAYFHVLADALTSLLAIVALLTGKFFGWLWMDPAMGIAGAVVILRWSYALLWDSGSLLLDAGVDPRVISEIQAAIEAEDDNRVCDIHVWRIGTRQLAATISLVTAHPKPSHCYKELIADRQELGHLAIEVNRCRSL